ncbi:hypothetical protein [Paenirhodobacter sp.]|uniref:hypothetical protein n=1 Tax=Paenirhodobacter sp. TaxID=1965326 RepID=UPI003B3E1DF3
MKKPHLLLWLVLLAACGGPPRSDAPAGSEEWFATTSPRDQASYFAAACRVYGLKPGSPEFTHCIREEMDRRHAQNTTTREQVREERRAEQFKHRTTETHCTRFMDTMSCESY